MHIGAVRQWPHSTRVEQGVAKWNSTCRNGVVPWSHAWVAPADSLGAASELEDTAINAEDEIQIWLGFVSSGYEARAGRLQERCVVKTQQVQK